MAEYDRDLERAIRDARNAEGERDAALRLLAGEREGRICQTAELRKLIDAAEAEARTYAKGYDAQHERADRLAALLSEAADSVHASLAEDGITSARKEYRMGIEARLRAALSPTGEATGRLPPGYRKGACICPCHDTPHGPCRCRCVEDLLKTVSDHDQTPEEARAELEADGVNVEAFLAKVRP